MHFECFSIVMALALTNLACKTIKRIAGLACTENAVSNMSLFKGMSGHFDEKINFISQKMR